LLSFEPRSDIWSSVHLWLQLKSQPRIPATGYHFPAACGAMVLSEHFFELLFFEYFNAMWTEFGPLERLCDKTIPWRSSKAALEATHFILLVCSDVDSTPNVELFIGWRQTLLHGVQGLQEHNAVCRCRWYCTTKRSYLHISNSTFSY
jgi:hypothetical protein